MSDNDLRPALTDVGAILRARTVGDADSGGREVGTFDTTTRPTGAEVDEFIDHALVEVELQLPATLPDDLPARLQAFTTRLIALRAAMFVEVSLFPDQVADGTSPYPQIKEMFDTGLARLLDAIGDISDAGGTRRSASTPILSPTAAATQADYDGSIDRIWAGYGVSDLLP